MRKLLGFCLAVLVNAMFIGAFAWSSFPPAPQGEVQIADVSNGDRIIVASRSP